ncbi:hypothetical protein Tco_0999492 [Tanacetum coccineum]
MFLNVEQLQKQFDKEEFQEIESMDAFRVLKTQFHMFINSQFSLDDDDGQMTSKVNERQMQTNEGKVDTCKALDASFVDTESNIKPVYEEEPMAEVQLTAEWQQGQFLNGKSNEAKVKKDIDDFETINTELEYSVATLLKENETLKKHYKELLALIVQNAEFKAQLQDKGFAIAALKNELRKLTGNSVNTKFAKPSILGKPFLEPYRNQSVVRQSTVFKSEWPRISKLQFSSQVDVNNDLSKPITTHYFPKERESAFAKPHHMIAPDSSRYCSNDMVKKKT